MMDDLKRRVKKELDSIGEKGLTTANLESAYKLTDIYKDILEICEKEEKMDNYDRGRNRDSMGRYTDSRSYYPLDERTERYLRHMREGMENYNEGRGRYRDGDSDQRMIEGIEMTMGAIVNFIDQLMDIAETNKEKEIVRHYVDKIKKI